MLNDFVMSTSFINEKQMLCTKLKKNVQDTKYHVNLNQINYVLYISTIQVKGAVPKKHIIFKGPNQLKCGRSIHTVLNIFSEERYVNM